MTVFSDISSIHRTLLLTIMFITMLLSIAVLCLSKLRDRKRFDIFINIILLLILFSLEVVFGEEKYIYQSNPNYRTALPIPVWALWCFTLCSVGWLVYKALQCRQYMKNNISLISIKYAMDTLPVAVCCFAATGEVRLCNHTMNSLFRRIAQCDLQSLSEFDEALDGCDERTGIIREKSDRNTFIFPDGKVWYYSRCEIVTSDGTPYIEALFTDVTELYEKRQDLHRQSREMKEIYSDIKRLSENVLEMTREKEILTAKIRLHDKMGAGIAAVRQILLHDRTAEENSAALEMWRKAVSLIKDDNRNPAGNVDAADIIHDAAAVGICVDISGNIPYDGETGRLIMLAIRECLTNAARHAEATVLHISAERSDGTITLNISNDGKPPAGEITPRGGLANLRRLVAEYGGSMKIQWQPEFMLTVSVPEEDTI